MHIDIIFFFNFDTKEHQYNIYSKYSIQTSVQVMLMIDFTYDILVIKKDSRKATTLLNVVHQKNLFYPIHQLRELQNGMCVPSETGSMYKPLVEGEPSNLQPAKWK